MSRHELTNNQWKQLAPLLPPQKSSTGRPAHDHRLIVNGILWLTRTGAPWRDLPEHYGPWQTVASRFYRWQKAGVWARVLAALQQQADARGAVDWSQHYVDGSVIRAHQHAAGARRIKGGQSSKHWDGVRVASAPSCICAPRAVASQLLSSLRQASGMSKAPSNRSWSRGQSSAWDVVGLGCGPSAWWGTKAIAVARCASICGDVASVQ